MNFFLEGFGRILDMRFNVLFQCCLTTWERWHWFNVTEDGISFQNLIIYRYRPTVTSVEGSILWYIGIPCNDDFRQTAIQIHTFRVLHGVQLFKAVRFAVDGDHVGSGAFQLEYHRQRVPYRYGLTVMAAWGELGQRLADAHRLPVKILIQRLDDHCVTDLTSLADNEAHNDTTLNFFFGGHGRVVDV